MDNVKEVVVTEVVEHSVSKTVVNRPRSLFACVVGSLQHVHLG